MPGDTHVRASLSPPSNRGPRKPPRFQLRAPVVREGPIHTQVADVLRLELCAPGKISRRGVTWWSVDMACYGGDAPGIRTSHGCISGVPDILILWRGISHFIELKAIDGSLSLAQQSVGTAILIANGNLGVARDASEVLALIDQWGIPRAGRVREAP